ncbi:hypothetical protein ACFLSA_06460 [Bacteroidota bacterium]
MKYTLTSIACLFSLSVFSQIGGSNTYAFLNLPNSSKVAALGGDLISSCGREAGLSYYNPSILNLNMLNEKLRLASPDDTHVDVKDDLKRKDMFNILCPNCLRQVLVKSL